ncbi:MAG: ABC transporter ATP-binding protein [Candidatus Wallbacteria bacterium]|nr:ABC transporter ATP-binding protein [Candidatus Wallbacteria bacterium]
MTASVELAGVSKRYQDQLITDSIDLVVAKGEFLTLLGPSGCGKTTTLRMIGGFEVPDEGTVRINGEDVTSLAPYQRRVNTVFQHYALFPHLTVFENIAYGLRRKGAAAERIREKVARGLDLIQMRGMEKKLPAQLSGGQKQRVAMARALACDPEVLLLDEPMSALDVKLRKEMQVELKHLQRELGLTFIFVTHDQEEALVMSDRIAVMNRGRLEHVGSAEEVYERPRTEFVADFLGVKNFFRGRLEGVAGEGRHRWLTESGLTILSDTAGSARPGDTRQLGVRPEKVYCGEEMSRPMSNQFAGTVDDLLYTGPTTSRRVTLAGGTALEALSPSRPGALAGSEVQVGFDSKNVLVLEAS